MIFFQVQCISIVKREANSTIEQQKCKGREKRDRLLISKMEINYQVPSEIKVLAFDQIFSNWVNFNKEVSMINCSTNSKSFKAIYFFYIENQKLKVIEKKQSVFFSVSLRSLLFSQSSIGYVFFSGIVLSFVQAQFYFFLRFDFVFLKLNSLPLLKLRQTRQKAY